MASGKAWPDASAALPAGIPDEAQLPTAPRALSLEKSMPRFREPVVKPANAAKDGIEKDLATLLHFRKYGYVRGIFLIYGADPEWARQRVLDYATNEQCDAIELWVHPEVGQSAQQVALKRSCPWRIPDTRHLACGA